MANVKTFQQLVKLETQGKISKKEKQRLAGFRAAQSRKNSKAQVKKTSKAQVKKAIKKTTNKAQKVNKAQVKKTQPKQKGGKKSLGFGNFRVNRDALVKALQTQKQKDLAPTDVVKITWQVIKSAKAAAETK